MTLRKIFSGECLNFGKVVDPLNGEFIIPVYAVESAQLATGGLAAIRMQGWANPEAVERTFQTGLVTFYSRSRSGLWVKGETSGSTLGLIAAYTDCDYDSLLLDVQANGPTCHNGSNSCFEVNTIGE